MNFANRKRFTSRIGFTLIIAFVALAVLPLAAVTLIETTLIDYQANEQVLNQLEALAAVKQTQIESLLDSGNATLNQALADSTLYSRITDVLALGGGRAVGLLTEDLMGHFNSQSTFKELFAYDLKGKVVVSTTETQVGIEVSGEPYFETSFGQPYVQAPYIETATGEFTLVISLPVVKADRVWGVLAGRVDTGVLQGIMTERTGLGKTGETYLVSRENNYLLTPSRFEGFAQNRAYHTEGIDAALAGNNGSGIYQNYQEIDVFGVYRWLPELQSGFIAEMNEEEGVATMIQVRNLSVLASAIAAGIAAVIGVGISLYITRPIEALTKIATQIAAGDHSQRAHIHQKNEIGQLADAFNIMTYQLVQSITQLDLNVKELDEANRDLKAATAKAEEASRLKDEFLAVMSHELRTPLNAIIGYLGILLMTGGLEERSNHMVKRVRANAERLLSLINDILEISRIEAGRLQLHPQEIELSPFVERLRENMGVLAEQKGLEFHVDFAYDLPPTCYADEDALTKVASNLLSNAIKFTQEGSVTLDVSRQECDLIIKVEDTGVGIPPHLHEVVFERFRQADSSSTRAQGGSGLGLSIVHHLCVAMNGTVTLESAPGEGSTFTVTLPILQDEMVQLVRE